MAADRLGIRVNTADFAAPRLDGSLAITDDKCRCAGDRAAIPVTTARGGGVIINIGSVNARLPLPMVVDHSAAKAAFKNLAKGLSKEFGQQNIRVTDLWPVIDAPP